MGRQTAHGTQLLPTKKAPVLFYFCLRHATQAPWRDTERGWTTYGHPGEFGAVVESPGKRKGTTRIANRNRRCGSGSRAALIMFKCMHRMQHRIDNTKTKSISASTPPPNTIYHNSPVIIEEGSWPSFMPPPSAKCALRFVAHCVSPHIPCDSGRCRASRAKTDRAIRTFCDWKILRA